MSNLPLSYSYDELGRETERKGYDMDGNLVICSEGYASCSSTYDENGNFVEMICYDTLLQSSF